MPPIKISLIFFGTFSLDLIFFHNWFSYGDGSKVFLKVQRGFQKKSKTSSTFFKVGRPSLPKHYKDPILCRRISSVLCPKCPEKSFWAHFWTSLIENACFWCALPSQNLYIIAPSKILVLVNQNSRQKKVSIGHFWLARGSKP